MKLVMVFFVGEGAAELHRIVVLNGRFQPLIVVITTSFIDFNDASIVVM